MTSILALRKSLENLCCDQLTYNHCSLEKEVKKNRQGDAKTLNVWSAKYALKSLFSAMPI